MVSCGRRTARGPPNALSLEDCNRCFGTMKSRFCPSVSGLLVGTAAGWLLIQSAGSAATFSVNPPVVSNTYSGLITLNVGGLTNGEQVAILKSIDRTAGTVIDAPVSTQRTDTFAW